MKKGDRVANEYPQVMTIAGSDCDGSAGMQADMNTFLARKAYGISVMTAAVAGNSYGIQASESFSPEFIGQQFAAIADDFQVRASKTGMMADTPTIEAVAQNYKKYDFGPLVVDPVIITKHGAMLLEESAYQTLCDQLIPLATVLTPNFYEAQKLSGLTLTTEADIEKAAEKLQALGAKNVIVKGKHTGDQATVRDFVLLEDGKNFWLEEDYVPTDRVNGTGDTLSACIAAEIAKGESIEQAIRIAKRFTHRAIANEIAVGHKFGPINHWVEL
jgi:hydroxymethylpyrimidine/phosphomethylpyrimidine kinase